MEPETIALIIQYIPEVVQLTTSVWNTINGKKYRNRRHKAESIYRAMNVTQLSDKDVNSCLGWLIPKDYRSDEEYLENIKAHVDAMSNDKAPEFYRRNGTEGNKARAAIALAAYCAKNGNFQMP